MLRCALALMALAAWAQTFKATPDTVRQGETIRIEAPAGSVSARMAGRTVRLFPQAGGGSLGLMPVPVATKPGRYRIEFLGDGGVPLHAAEVTVRDARFPVQNVSMSRETAELQPAPGEMETVAAFRDSVSEKRYWQEALVAPVPGCMVSRFGVKRAINGKITGNFHGGIDQRSPAGRPIRAVADGVVRIVRKFNVHGGTVAIDHGQGLGSIYLHMSGFAAAEGAVVKRGDTIGYIGSTGRSTAPHLHWSLYVNGVPVNPLQWIALQPCGAANKKNGGAGKR